VKVDSFNRHGRPNPEEKSRSEKGRGEDDREDREEETQREARA